MDASSPEPCKSYTVVMVDNAMGKETFDLIQAHVVTKLKASSSKGNATLARIAQKATFFPAISQRCSSENFMKMNCKCSTNYLVSSTSKSGTLKAALFCARDFRSSSSSKNIF